MFFIYYITAGAVLNTTMKNTEHARTGDPYIFIAVFHLVALIPLVIVPIYEKVVEKRYWDKRDEKNAI